MTVLNIKMVQVVAAISLCASLASCSGDQDSAADQAAAEKAKASQMAARIAPPDLPVIPQVKQAVGAVSDLEIGNCPVAAGKQMVTGTLTASGKKTRDYVVVISWINDRSDVRGRAVVVEKDVDPGQSRPLKLTAPVAEGASTCVPNVQAGKVEK